MIPKILHQIWIGDNPIPERLKQLHRNMCEKHPKWIIFLWTNASVKSLCEPWQYEHATLAGSSNVLRLHALRKYGGIYLDMDYEIIKPLDELCENVAFVARQPDGVFCNSAMGAVEDHPWITAMIENYGDQRKKDASWGCYIIEPHLTPDVTILPTDTFYCNNWDEPLGEIAERTLARHLWDGSWVHNASDHQQQEE